MWDQESTTRCTGVHEEIEALKDAFLALCKQGKYDEAAELMYTEKAVIGVGGADLAPARAST